jgi:hypothetical protein
LSAVLDYRKLTADTAFISDLQLWTNTLLRVIGIRALWKCEDRSDEQSGGDESSEHHIDDWDVG